MLGNKRIMGRNIQAQMDLHGLSRKDFSKAIGEPYSSVTDWINGKTYPRIDKIQKMADFFGIEKADLVEYHGDVVSENPDTTTADVQTNVQPPYYTDDESRAMAEFYHNNPAYRTLLDAARKIKPKDIGFAQQFLERFGGDDES